jgi:nucleoside-diphosphate-sugar epimerase
VGRIGVALVTGVSGHAAGVMADRLRAGGFEVRALVRTPGQARAAAQRGLVPVPGDLTAPRSLAPAVAGARVVVHAAAYAGADPALAGQVNVAGTRWLAEAARHAGIERFVHVSSMSVHGEPQPDGLDEDSPLRPDAAHPYVASKARAELELTAARSRGLPVVILRPGAICAATRSRWGDGLVARLRGTGWPPDRHPGDVIPWVHGQDLAEMTWLAATCPAAAGQVFLAVDRNITLGEYFVPIITALGHPVRPPDRAPVLSRCRTGKIRQTLGYTPQQTFEHTLSELIQLARISKAARAG